MKSPSKDYLTGSQSEMFWHYSVPPHVGQKVQLLTVGGVATTGQWTGELGQNFVAWAPLLKVDHAEVARVIREHQFRVCARLSEQIVELTHTAVDPDAVASEMRVVRAMYLSRLPEAARMETDLIRPGSLMRLNVAGRFTSHNDRLIFERVISNPHEPLFSMDTFMAQFVFSERAGLWVMIHPEDWPSTMSRILNEAITQSGGQTTREG